MKKLLFVLCGILFCTNVLIAQELEKSFQKDVTCEGKDAPKNLHYNQFNAEDRIAKDWQIIENQDFEGSFPSGLWECGYNSGYAEATWDDWYCWYHSSDESAGCADDGGDGISCGDDYPNNMYSWMIYGPFDLSSTSDADFEFYFTLQCENNTNYDYFFVGSSINGTNFIGDKYAGNYNNEWVDFDLSNLIGETEVWIGFIFKSDGTVNMANGAQVDDVIIWKNVEGPGCNIDDYEPDDSNNQANWIYNNDNQTHTICPETDEDWVKFSLSSSANVHVWTDGPDGDTRMWLYNSNLTELAYDDDGGNGQFSDIEIELSSGTYYVKVDEYGNNDFIDPYDINISWEEMLDCIPDIEYVKINGTEVSFEGTIDVELSSLDETFEIKLRGENDGSDDAPDGISNLTLAFPQYTSNSDKNRIEIDGSSTSDDLNVQKYFGSEAMAGDGYADYVMVEGSDEDGWEDGESNNIYLNVKPKDWGDFYIEFRMGLPTDNSWDNFVHDPPGGYNPSGNENQNNIDPIKYYCYYIKVNVISSSIQTRIKDNHIFIDKTAKFGIPILLEAKLQYYQNYFWWALPDETINIQIYKDEIWQDIPDDNISTTDLKTDPDGIASIYFTPTSDMAPGPYYIRAFYNGNSTYAPSEILQKNLTVKIPKWLFIVYLCADNDLEEYGCTDYFYEMYDARDNDEVSIVVLFDRIPGYSNYDPTWENTKYLRMSNNSVISNNFPNDEANMGNPNTLAWFLNQAELDCLANNRALILWNHGSGIRDDDQPDEIKSVSLIEQSRSLVTFTTNYANDPPWIGGVCSDETSGNDRLSIRDIRLVLNDKLNFEIIGFDACVMGEFEVIYDLHEQSNFIIASEENEDVDGWEYNDFLTSADLTSTTTPAQLSTNIVNSFPTPIWPFPKQTLGAWNNNSQILLLSTEISDFASKLIELMPTSGFKTFINNERSNTTKFQAYSNGDEVYIDLRDFCINIASSSSNTSLVQKANTIANRLVNTNFRHAWKTSYGNDIGGLSIYFPPNTSSSFSLYLSNDYLNFVNDPNQNWDDFLVAYFDGDDPSCSILTPNNGGWFVGDIAVTADANDPTTDILYVEFHYSLDHSNWYPVPDPNFPEGKDCDGSDGWGVNFPTINTPEHGTINDDEVFVRARASDLSGNLSNWDECNNSFGVDNSDPNVPNVSNCSHNTVTWSSDNTIEISWTCSDNGPSGIQGYSWIWNQSPTQGPDNNLNPGGNSTTSNPLSNANNWYFHIKAQDNAGNWGSVLDYGPFYIDSDNPNQPSITSCTHLEWEWYTNTNVTIMWSCSDNGPSGIEGYSFLWDHSTYTEPDNNINGAGTQTSETLTEGFWYFHVKAKDNAGNWGETKHYGPTMIDLTAPTGSITINNDDPSTSSLIVELNLPCDDNMGGEDKMRLSNNESSWTEWMNYQNYYDNWDLSNYGGNSNPGLKTVSVEYKDEAGNISISYSDDIQYELYLNVSIDEWPCGPDAGEFTFLITSNVSWEIIEACEWIETYPTSGNGDDEILVQYLENNSANPRECEIEINGGDITRTLIVNQEGTDPYIIIDPTYKLVNYLEGLFVVEVQSNIEDWEVYESCDWVDIVLDNDEFTVNYDENPDPEVRSCTITVSGEGVSEILTLEQDAAPYLTIYPIFILIEPPAGSFTFTVSSNITWEIEESCDWLEVDPSNGSGDDEVTVTYDDNTTAETRYCTITVSGEGLSEELIVEQSPVELIPNFVGDPLEIYEGGEVNFENLSQGYVSSQWNFEGGDPATSTETNPTVTYNEEGLYDVTLTVSNGYERETKYEDNYISVLPQTLISSLICNTEYQAGTINNLSFTLHIETPTNDYGTYFEVELPVGFAPSDASSINYVYPYIDGQKVIWDGWFYYSAVPENFNFTITADIEESVSGNQNGDYLVKDYVNNEFPGNYTINGCINSQVIQLPEGFSFRSTYIIHENPDMEVVLQEVLNDNLVFVRNSNGETFRQIGPIWVNGIGDWLTTEGYLFKMNADEQLNLAGSIIDPLTPIPLSEGFQFVGFLKDYEISATDAFASIIGDNLHFARNSNGQTLRKIGPIWVNGIGNCIPGEGYLIKMYADDILIYPEGEKASSINKILTEYYQFNGGNPADPVYTIYVEGLEIGDEVAAYDGNVLIGAMKINSKNAFDNDLPVFNTINNGRGYKAGNPVILKVWDATTQSLIPFEYTYADPYNEAYMQDVYPSEDGLYSIIKIKKGDNIIERTQETISIFPNPSEGIFNISIEGVSGKVQMKVFDVHGNNYRIFEIEGAGNITEKLDLKELAAGVYFISFSGENFSRVKKIVIQ